MKKFMAVCTFTPESFEKWMGLDESTRKKQEDAGMAAWDEWCEKNRSAIVDLGTPLGKTKRASKAGIADGRNNLAGYCIVQADSHEAAAKLYENHPHFTFFPGEAVEIMECLPIPAR